MQQLLQIKRVMHWIRCATVLLLVTSCSKQKLQSLEPNDDNGGLYLPKGFSALVVADSIGPTRHIAVNSNGDIYAKLRIIDGQQGNVALRDVDFDGRADLIQRFGDYPNDGSFATEMRIHNGFLYFSSELVVYRQKLITGELIPEGKPETILIDTNPIRWHNAKSLAFDNQGGMFVTFSAPTNACEDWSSVNGPPYAGVKSFNPCPELIEYGGIWRFDQNRLRQYQADGELYATGIRSVVAISWNESDESLYAIQHGRDYLQSHAPEHYSEWQNAVLPAEEFMKVKKGDNYGWPYTYYDQFLKKRILAPEYGGDGRIESTDFSMPLIGLPAHWAPNDLLFYKGSQFPSHYKDGAFVAFHGSTNRSPYAQGGYVVAFIPFINGTPSEKWEVFADGFLGADSIKMVSEAKYRPMALAEGPDGSLYISESKNGKIWRVIYTGNVLEFGEKDLMEMEQRKSKPHLRIPTPPGK